MSAGIIALLFLFSCLLACGQILFKTVARTSESLATLPGLLGLATNIWFWSALVLYGGATLLWIFILQKTPLSQAYPFVALGFIIVPAAGHFFFQEPIGIPYFGGIILILGGLWLITTSANQF